MIESCTKSTLSVPRMKFIELLQRLSFGKIEGLVIHEGEPILNPPPRIIRDVKFRGENGPRPESNLDDFVLKAEVVDLFAQFDMLTNGTIRSLEVKYGLPFRMEMEEMTA